MKKLMQRVLVTTTVMAALAAAVIFNVSEAEAAASRTCAMIPFVPVVCTAISAAGVQEGVAGAQDQPVVDFLGAADNLANGAAGVCRGRANYPGGITRSTTTTAGLPLNTSAYPTGSAAGWYLEPAAPMVSVSIQCF